MPNNEDEWIDELLATHRSETWSTGWNNDASDKAKAAIKAKLLEARMEEVNRIVGGLLAQDTVQASSLPEDTLQGYMTGYRLAYAEVNETCSDRIAQLQASAPTKKGVES